MMAVIDPFEIRNAAGKKMCRECKKYEAVGHHRYGDYCENCAEVGVAEEAMYDDVDREYSLRSKGICVECRKEKARGGSDICVGCFEFGIRDSYVDRQMCRECKKEKAKASWGLCVNCEALGIRDEERRRAEEIGAKMCVECKKEKIPGRGTLCDSCIESGLLDGKMCGECKKEKIWMSGVCRYCFDLGIRDEDPVEDKDEDIAEDKSEEVGAKMCGNCKNEQVGFNGNMCDNCASLGIQVEDPVEDYG